MNPPALPACVLERVSDVVWAADAFGCLTYVNPADEALRGCAVTEMLGRDFREALVPADATGLASQFAAFRADPNRHTWRFEARQQRKGGEPLWMETQVTAVRAADGTVEGFVGISRDISDRRRAGDGLSATEAELTYERDLFEALLNASPDDIYFKDRQSRIVRMSRSKALTLLETVPNLRQRRAAKPDADPMELVYGITDFDTYNHEDAQKAFDDEQRIIGSGEPLLGKLEHQVFQDGTEVWFITDKFPWRNRAGDIIGTFGVSKDISELKQAEKALEEVTKELVSASRSAGMAEVATGVLHNVGNAVNSVNVSVSVAIERLRGHRAASLVKVLELFDAHQADLATYLSTDGRVAKVTQYLHAISEAVEADRGEVLKELNEIRKGVDHIKDIVAMQQAYATTAGLIEPVKLQDIVEDAIRMNQAALQRHAITLVRQYECPAVVATDRHKVLQVLVNVIRNAKYACDEANPPEKRIEVSIGQRGDEAWIAIRDNGVGIPAENLERVFQHGFTTRKDGHGFGLHSGALCARELGGSLSVASAGRGQGAVFTLRLPCAAPAAAMPPPTPVAAAG